jgi:hypothetical protein
MNRASLMLAAGLSAVFAMSSIVPAQALPNVPQRMDVQPAQSGIELARAKVKVKVWRGNRNWRGHRGYRAKRYGYRRHHNGYWYPRSAFTVRIAPRARAGGGHMRWCRNHYASYRASDNTFKPYNGQRRVCRSPYR